MSFGGRGARGGAARGGGGFHPPAPAYDYGGYGGQAAGSVFIPIISIDSLCYYLFCFPGECEHFRYNGGVSSYDHISYDTSSKDPAMMRFDPLYFSHFLAIFVVLKIVLFLCFCCIVLLCDIEQTYIYIYVSINRRRYSSHGNARICYIFVPNFNSRGECMPCRNR